MSGAPVITMVGAGGMSFGPSMVNDVVNTPELAGSRLVLHDINGERLQRAYVFAAKLNAAHGAPVVLDRTTDPEEALDGADFVISSAEIGRFRYWRQDFEVANRHGARQINAENGGPGAVFHSLRSIKTTLGICADVEKYSPDAFFINLSNPMSRVTLAVNRATKLRNAGMCHEMPIGVYRLCLLLRRRSRDIEAKASGINHFTFFTEFRDRTTGEDLLPRIHDLFARRAFDYPERTRALVEKYSRFTLPAACADQFYTPLVVHMVREYGIVPCSVDSHIGEYLPFALDVADDHFPVWEFFERLDRVLERLANRAIATHVPLPFHRVGHSLEEVIPLIAAQWTGTPAGLTAVNVPNLGYLPNIADGAIVEVGATVDGDGIHPEAMPPLVEPVAGYTATQVALQDLIVESALTGNPDLALKAIIEDPCSPADEDACRAIFEELCALQADALPF
jgi:alpha-galactosidase/6-phospho-beta-glucosidase family protein